MSKEVFSGEKLTHARQQIGWTQQHLSARLGVSTSTVSNWEQGLSLPAAAWEQKLSELLERPRAWFACPAEERASKREPLVLQQRRVLKSLRQLGLSQLMRLLPEWPLSRLQKLLQGTPPPGPGELEELRSALGPAFLAEPSLRSGPSASPSKSAGERRASPAQNLKGTKTMGRPFRVTGFNGVQLRRARRDMKMSQGDLAERLGIHRTTVVNWESDLSDPTRPQAEQLAGLLERELEWFYQAPVEIVPPNDMRWITDEWLRGFPLERMQQLTAGALSSLRTTVTDLTRRSGLQRRRIEALLEGAQPTAQELQKLREGLGESFNPTPTLMRSAGKRRPPEAARPDDELRELLEQVLKLQQEQAERLQRLEAQLEDLTQWARLSSQQRTEPARKPTPSPSELKGNGSIASWSLPRRGDRD